MYVIKKADGSLRSEARYTLAVVEQIVNALNKAFGEGSYYYEAV